MSQIIQKKPHKFEDQIFRLQNLNLLGNDANNKPVTWNSDLYTDLLKNRIIELKNQLSDTNAIINYLTMQLIPKSQDKTIICSCSHNNNHKAKINKDKNNDNQLEKEDSSNRVVIIGNSNINNHGLSKTKKVDGLNFSGATSTDILTKFEDVLDRKPESIIIHVCTNDANLLSNKKKKIVSKTNMTSHNT